MRHDNRRRYERGLDGEMTLTDAADAEADAEAEKADDKDEGTESGWRVVVEEVEVGDDCGCDGNDENANDDGDDDSIDE